MIERDFISRAVCRQWLSWAVLAIPLALLGHRSAYAQPPSTEDPSAAETPAAPEAEAPAAPKAEPPTEGSAPADGAAERPRPPLPERLAPFLPAVERDLTLIVAADAPSEIFIDGAAMGKATPEEELEITIHSTDRKLRAVSTEVPAATWEKRLAVPPEGDRMRVAVKMERAIRGLRREELKTAVIRWLDEGLMWMRRDGGRDLDWDEARESCEELGLAGFDDWRLPSLEELRGMEAIWSRNPYKILGGIALSGCCPWSADTDGDERAWNFDYRFRREFAGNRALRLGHRALCVRSMGAEEIATAEENLRKAKRKRKPPLVEDDLAEEAEPDDPPLR